MAAGTKAQAGAGFAEGMKKVLQQVAVLSTEPDADVNFCAQIQGAIVAFLKQGMPGGQQQGQPGQPTTGAGPAGAPAGPQGGPPPGMMTGGAMQGLTPGPQAADELSRLMGGGGGIS